MAIPHRNTNTGASDYYKPAWTGTAGDYNILENGPGGSEGCQHGVCCRYMIVTGGTGALVVIDPDGNDVTIPQAIITASPRLDIQAQALVGDGSGNYNVMLFW